jgi:hypothetical protein
VQEEEHDDGLRGVRVAAGVSQIGSRIDVREQTSDVERFLHHVHFGLEKVGVEREECASGPNEPTRTLGTFPNLRFSWILD